MNIEYITCELCGLFGIIIGHDTLTHNFILWLNPSLLLS